MHNVCLQKSINEQLCIPLGKNLPVFAAEVVCLDVRQSFPTAELVEHLMKRMELASPLRWGFQ